MNRTPEAPMSKPFDETLKHLTELSPQDWVVRGGWSAAPATTIDADIATIAGAADKAIRVAGAPDWLLSVDFHAGHDTAAKLPNLLLYNSALYRRHDLLVRTLLVVLHRGADSPQLTGTDERGFPGEPPDVTLRYRVVRVWQVPANHWLSGGLGLVPLAPLGELRTDQLPAVIGRVKRRLEREAAPGDAADLWSAMYILMGLRYEQALVQRLLQGVLAMRESVTYQAILEEGRAEGEARGEARGKTEEARRMLLLFAREKLGEPSAAEQTALEAVTDLKGLELLAQELKRADSWQDLLAPPASRRRSPRRRSS
jgi:predicted transposase YdaD